MPPAVRDFVTGSCQNLNKIYVLLVNMQLLTNGNMLTRSDYDYLVEGFYRPFIGNILLDNLTYHFGI